MRLEAGMKASRWAITADKFLAPEQIATLIDHLKRERDLSLARGSSRQPVRDYYLIRAALETGVRVFELCALKDADLAGHRLTVRRGKGDKPRTVLLTRATALLLKEWLALKGTLCAPTGPETPLFPSRYGTPYTTRGVQKRIKIAFAACGFPAALAAHALRHTYASLLIGTGKVGMATVKENLGHSSLAVTNLYAHALGNLEQIDLLPVPSSPIYQKDELQAVSTPRNSKDLVKEILRNANFKRR
jgi:integrase